MNDTSQEMQWISVEDSLPEYLEGKDYSANVLCVINGYNNIPYISIANLVIVEYTENSHLWAFARLSRCFGDLLTAECEFDDDYEITHWMPLPQLPKSEVVTEAIAQIQRAKLNEAAMNGELPSIIDSLVDDE